MLGLKLFPRAGGQEHMTIAEDTHGNSRQASALITASCLPHRYKSFWLATRRPQLKRNQYRVLHYRKLRLLTKYSHRASESHVHCALPAIVQITTWQTPPPIHPESFWALVRTLEICGLSTVQLGHHRLKQFNCRDLWLVTIQVGPAQFLGFLSFPFH